jgi:hypothetical protein
MKYMLLTYAQADFDIETFVQEKGDWVGEMVAFMHQLNADLEASGELVTAEGLADPSQTKTVRFEGDDAVTTDGPFAGFWIVDVVNFERAAEIAAKVVRFVKQGIEIRPIGEEPTV